MSLPKQDIIKKSPIDKQVKLQPELNINKNKEYKMKLVKNSAV